MKLCIGALAASTALLAVSFAFGQQNRAAGSTTPDKDSSIYAELAKAPEKTRSKRNPLDNDPDAIAAGKNLFERHCAECHGDAAEGGKKGPSLRAREVQNSTSGAIFWILTNGVVRRGMPVWSKLPEPQRWQLVAYIKSLGVKPSNPLARVGPDRHRLPACSFTRHWSILLGGKTCCWSLDWAIRPLIPFNSLSRSKGQ